VQSEIQRLKEMDFDMGMHLVSINFKWISIIFQGIKFFEGLYQWWGKDSRRDGHMIRECVLKIN
jgi:hypothetical protein